MSVECCGKGDGKSVGIYLATAVLRAGARCARVARWVEEAGCCSDDVLPRWVCRASSTARRARRLRVQFPCPPSYSKQIFVALAFFDREFLPPRHKRAQTPTSPGESVILFFIRLSCVQKSQVALATISLFCCFRALKRCSRFFFDPVERRFS